MKQAVSLFTVIVMLILAGCGSDDNTVAITGIDTSYPVNCSGAETLTAEGATVQQNTIDLFNLAWRKLCPGKNLSYNPTGSGAGQQQFIAGHIDFAGSDSPLSRNQAMQAYRRCSDHPAWHLPLVFGALVLAYHLEGVPTLTLTPSVIAGIFAGTITQWSDPAIKQLNPNVSLPTTGPSSRIIPIFRADAAGSTDAFQQYLSVAAPQVWTGGIGHEFHGSNGEGAHKSVGVIRAVQNTPGALGYVEKDFAEYVHLPFASIDTGSGSVTADDTTVTAALNTIQFTHSENHDLIVDLDALYATQRSNIYPLILVSYEIVCSAGYGSAKADALRSFLNVATNNAQGLLRAAGHTVLPKRFQEQLTLVIKEIQP